MPGGIVVCPPANQSRAYQKKPMPTITDNDTLCIDSIRCLGAALPQKANSGHPGAPMGCAPMAHALYTYVMNYSPKNPEWWNRDRFVLSNGHGCALLYTMLHMTGYPDMSMDDLQNFRQLNSRTPGHPESHSRGIEVTTGPLGQGIAQAVGLAMANEHFAAKFNKPDVTLFDNYTFVICGDGCLQEGVASEASSLAGHLKLGRLVMLYDDNGITIDGATGVSFTESVKQRYEAYGWQVSEVSNGDTDLASIIEAVENAKTYSDKPSLIVVKTTIGYGSTKQGTAKTHGAPLGVDDIAQARKKFGLADDMFHIDGNVVEFYKKVAAANDAKMEKWTSEIWNAYQTKYPTEAAELSRRFKGELPSGWEDMLPKFTADDKPNATRALSHAALNAVAAKMHEIVGGSADLTESNKTDIKGETDFSGSNYAARYFRFGVREHGMAAICNGLFAYGGLRPFGATFLNFISYAWGAVRLSAISGFGVLYIATHDSIELGEDGPTHQPIEMLPLLRATPNLLLVRPADHAETSGAYAVWLKNKNRPTVMALSRGNVPNLSGTSAKSVEKGGYIVEDFEASRPNARKVVLAGSGTELQLCVEAKQMLETQHSDIVVRIVSMPCWELFEEQSSEYKRSVLPKVDDAIALLYCEAASTFGIEKYFNIAVGMTSFGASAPKTALWNHFGFTKENIAEKVLSHLNKK